MPANLQRTLPLITELLRAPAESKPLSQGFHMQRETAGQSDPKSTHLTDNWQKRENTEHSDIGDEVKLHELMEDVKRYIRSIDIRNL